MRRKNVLYLGLGFILCITGCTKPVKNVLPTDANKPTVEATKEAVEDATVEETDPDIPRDYGDEGTLENLWTVKFVEKPELTNTTITDDNKMVTEFNYSVDDVIDKVRELDFLKDYYIADAKSESLSTGGSLQYTKGIFGYTSKKVDFTKDMPKFMVSSTGDTAYGDMPYGFAAQFNDVDVTNENYQEEIYNVIRCFTSDEVANYIVYGKDREQDLYTTSPEGLWEYTSMYEIVDCGISSYEVMRTFNGNNVYFMMTLRSTTAFTPDYKRVDNYVTSIYDMPYTPENVFNSNVGSLTLNSPDKFMDKLFKVIYKDYESSNQVDATNFAVYQMRELGDGTVYSWTINNNLDSTTAETFGYVYQNNELIDIDYELKTGIFDSFDELGDAMKEAIELITGESITFDYTGSSIVVVGDYNIEITPTRDQDENILGYISIKLNK